MVSHKTASSHSSEKILLEVLVSQITIKALEDIFNILKRLATFYDGLYNSVAQLYPLFASVDSLLNSTGTFTSKYLNITFSIAKKYFINNDIKELIVKYRMTVYKYQVVNLGVKL